MSMFRYFGSLFRTAVQNIATSLPTVVYGELPMYVGCLEVKQSTRTLPFEVRGQVTKEAIFRVCDASGFAYARKKKANRNIVKVLGDVPNVKFGGANVNLTISTTSINLTVMETGKVIANHQMQGISFASGGDQETPDYVAYVAKDPVNGRACHVLECLGGLAQDVITTVGQAFEIRFKEYLKNPPQALNAPDKFAEPIFGEGDSAWGDDPEYYNDITKLEAHSVIDASAPPQLGPGQYMAVNGALPPNPYASLKTPHSPSADVVPSAPTYDNRVPVRNTRFPGQHPEMPGSPSPVYDSGQNSPTPSGDSTIYNMPNKVAPGYDNPPLPMPRSNLPPPLPAVYGDHSGMEEGVYNSSPHSFKSPPVPGQNGSGHRTDMFDMEPFNPSNQKRHPRQLSEEEWYHGPMSRREGEALLEEDGDFLVRESTSSKGQYVLSGMQNGQPKHLLLVDPRGKVRTKDKEFESVSHLIQYHRSQDLPIISAGSAVFLKHPVLNARAAGNFAH
ncbi:putative SHC-transforming protein 1 isoform X3 [Apostichopus japonicus]|uniref:Putative SHC-transforming protein 1 isoform X3 n=1 Tax=Stichopus japonicus TaxID=307972 RepID=A0A2G8LMA0_STIJA|nr:putative SHC-transforming protein 1 isoform X3 [Apostichopus japonicus]